MTKSTDQGATWSTPVAVSAQTTGHQFFPWIAASGSTLRVVYYDSRGDANYATTRAPCNSSSGHTSACLIVFLSTFTDSGTSSPDVMLNTAPTNPDLEQFGRRRIPFFGDYIMVAAVGSSVAAVWTDQRNAATAADASGDNDGADVAGDPETGGTCTSSFTKCFDGTGGLDQNIYTASL